MENDPFMDDFRIQLVMFAWQSVSLPGPGPPGHPPEAPAPLGTAKPDWMPAKYGFHRPIFHDSVNQSLGGALEYFLYPIYWEYWE